MKGLVPATSRHFCQKMGQVAGTKFWPLQTGLNSLDKTLRLVPQNRLNCLWNKFSRPSMISSQNSKILIDRI